MSRFWKKFLREGKGVFSRETKPQVYLGAFGKHPGWDDHIDDIGLETDSLLFAKQILYVDGIGGQINSGEWEKLSEVQRISEFKHLFVWKRGDAFLFGRIWASRDGKNRTRYPMIVCAHCLNVPFQWADRNLWPVLDEVERLCRETQSAGTVREILGGALGNLRRSLADVNRSLPEAHPGSSEFSDCLGQPNPFEGLYRVLYHVHNQLAHCRAGAIERSGQIRLPARGMPTEALALWIRFLESQFGTDAPILLMLPLDGHWLDAVVGEPVSRDFFSLRATPEILPVVSDVPYTITDDFRKTHQATVKAMCENNPDAKIELKRQGWPKIWFQA